MLSRFGQNFQLFPMNQVADIRDKLEEVFDEAYGRVSDWVTIRYPYIDMIDTGNEVVVYAEIPGCKKEDLKVNVIEGNLIISGNRNPVNLDEDSSFIRNERPSGTFSRSFSLPEHIDTTKINAKYEGGVLEIHLPKHEAVRPKHIEVNVQ